MRQKSQMQRNENKVIDFIVIGAQKAGTTSLFRYLQGHPQLYLLPQKEAAFFSTPEFETRGFDWYLNTYYGSAPPNRLWGKATPQYMIDHRVPARMARTLPKVRLIALLRNPLARSYSHYKMLCRREQVRMDVSQLVEELAIPNVAEGARLLPVTWAAEPRGVLALGEYGRILENYCRYFRPEQMLILFTEGLAARPQQEFRRVLVFLGVSEDYVPPNLRQRYHVGGRQQRFAGLMKALKTRPVKALGRLLSQRQRQYLLFWLGIANTKKEDDDADRDAIDEATRQKLVEYYRNDIALLEERFKIHVPWTEFAR